MFSCVLWLYKIGFSSRTCILTTQRGWLTLRTCRSAYKILLIYICCAFVGIDNKQQIATVIVRCLAVGNVSQFEISEIVTLLEGQWLRSEVALTPTEQGKFVTLCHTLLTVLNQVNVTLQYSSRYLWLCGTKKFCNCVGFWKGYVIFGINLYWNSSMIRVSNQN